MRHFRAFLANSSESSHSMGEKKRHYEQWSAEEKRQLIQVVN